MKVDLSLEEGEMFFRTADREVAICADGLDDWFDFPDDVKQITLVVEEDAAYVDESIHVYYYPSVNSCFSYDTYGLTRSDMFESLYLLDPAIDFVIEKMGLPPQGVFSVSLEYEE